ncbi:hypothetical protein CMI37_30020 [Candidatus Pacearchaeota archaeon]|nr:hypothetical protein [Candidatus Pacearchaeota archaeon]
MAIQKVTGEIIENNLLRSDSLAFNTDLLYIDVINDRIGINTSAPGTALDVTGSIRVTGDMIVQGNLDVEGQTSVIDTVNVEVEDPMLLLGRNNSGSDIDLGIMMNRGAGNDNAVIYWNEGEDTFKMVTSSSADSTTSITDTAYAPLQVGKITVDQEIEITDNEIRTLTSNTDLSLSAAGTGNVVFEGTGQVTVPVGTTAQRPQAVIGMIRFNSTTGFYEGSADGSTYSAFDLHQQGVPITKDVYTTGNASTTDFTLTLDPSAANNVIVYVDNVIQEPAQNYTLSGSTLTLTSAPHSGARVIVMHGFD